MHPLDDIAPVVKRTPGKSSIAHIAYFCDPTEEIVFCSYKPSLVMTYKAGVHSLWKLRTTTFQVRLKDVESTLKSCICFAFKFFLLPG